MYKELLQHNNKKLDNPDFFKLARDLKKYFTEKDIRMLIKCMKRYLNVIGHQSVGIKTIIKVPLDIQRNS